MNEEEGQPDVRDNALAGPAILHVGLPLDSAFSFEENRRPLVARVSPLTLGKAMIVERRIKLGSVPYDDESSVEIETVVSSSNDRARPSRLRLDCYAPAYGRHAVHLEERHRHELPRVLRVLRDEKRKGGEIVVRLSDEISFRLTSNPEAVWVRDAHDSAPPLPFYVFERIVECAERA